MSFLDLEHVARLAHNPTMVACYVGLGGVRAADYGWGEFSSCAGYARVPVEARWLFRDPAGRWTITRDVVFKAGEEWGIPTHYFVFSQDRGGCPEVWLDLIPDPTARAQLHLTRPRLLAGKTATIKAGSMYWT